MKAWGISTRRILAALVGVALLGSVCLLRPAEVDGAPTHGGKIVFAARQDIYTLDPQLAKWASERKILRQCSDTPVVIKPEDGKFYPGSANRGTSHRMGVPTPSGSGKT